MKKINKKIIAASAAGLAVVFAPSAFAVTASETAISTAITSGETMVGLIAPGVIGIAAIMMGVGIAVAWLKK